MVDPNTRQGKRTPVTLKIKFKSETLEQFIERYAVDVSQGGIFIRTKEPLAVGTQMKFEFQLKDASPLIAGEGTVVWTRENDPSRPAIAPGMGVRFDRLADGSQPVLERILAEKAKQAPQRSQNESTKPPMFTDTPTRVAPIPTDPLQHKSGPIRKRSDSEHTPLPRPMPFHSDADEFPEEAFEEATKVRALDELVAATADPGNETAIMPPDELAQRRTTSGRADSTLADPPTAVVAPEPSGRTPKILDTSPSPRTEAVGRSAPTASTPPVDQAKTRLGLEPAKADTSRPIAVAKDPPFARNRESKAPPITLPEPAPPAAKQPSSAPIVIGILVVVAGALAAGWYFFLRENVVDNNRVSTNPDNGSATAKGSDNGSNAMKPDNGSNAMKPDNGSNAATGSNTAVADTGSNGSAAHPMTGSNTAVQTPSAPMVDTSITASVDKAKITISGADKSGASPFTAKLEKGKQYMVRVEAPGYVALDLNVTAGDKATAKLVAKPHPRHRDEHLRGRDDLHRRRPDRQANAVGRRALEGASGQGSRQASSSASPATSRSISSSTRPAFTEDDTKLSAAADAKLRRRARCRHPTSAEHPVPARARRHQKAMAAQRRLIKAARRPTKTAVAAVAAEPRRRVAAMLARRQSQSPTSTS